MGKTETDFANIKAPENMKISENMTNLENSEIPENTKSFMNIENQTKAFYEIAEQLEKLAYNTLSEEIHSVRNTWKGDNGKILLEKIEKLQKMLQEDARETRKNANLLQEAAQNPHHIPRRPNV